MESHIHNCSIERMYFYQTYRLEVDHARHYGHYGHYEQKDDMLYSEALHGVTHKAEPFKETRQIGDEMIVFLLNKLNRQELQLNIHTIEVRLCITHFYLHIPLVLYNVDYIRQGLIRQATDRLYQDAFGFTRFTVHLDRIQRSDLVQIMEDQEKKDWGVIPAIPAREGVIYL